MAPEVAFTALHGVRTRFWVPLSVPSCRWCMKPASRQEISCHALSGYFFQQPQPETDIYEE